ncbi:hypothetical protein VE02_06479 [Pseudogymnoascus sp. 03VT05]|nr:hypothetical protein VE02_06479 [Pseudogymnoascus sp. 03VT05]
MSTAKAKSKSNSHLNDDEVNQLDTDSVTTSDNSTSKVKNLSTHELEKQKEDDDRVLAAAANDPRFKQITDRRLLRFSRIFERGKAAMDMKEIEKVFDFSDEATDQVEFGSKWIECKKGNHVLEEIEGDTDGTDNFRRLTEMEKAGQGDGDDCACEICTSRAKFQAYVDSSVEEDRKRRTTAA